MRLRNQVLGEGLAALSRFETDSYSRKSLLFKLILAVLVRYDIRGLGYLPSVVGRLFKSGLARFGLSFPFLQEGWLWLGSLECVVHAYVILLRRLSHAQIVLISAIA